MKKVIIIPIVIGVIIIGVMVGLALENNKQDDGKLTAQKLTENASPIFGDANAPITILEWGDYQCTYCYRFHTTTLSTINKEYIQTGKAKLVFRDFPLNGPDSVMAAEAAYCAGEQGKYWEYHDELYQNWAGERTGWVNQESLQKFANVIGVNMVDFNDCMDSKRYNQRVLDHYAYGQKIGIDATPSFLIFNSEKIVKITGNQPLEVFQKVLDQM